MSPTRLHPKLQHACYLSLTPLRGLAGNAVSLVYYGAPLSTMAEVIKTRNSASILLPLTLMNLLNALLWWVCLVCVQGARCASRIIDAFDVHEELDKHTIRTSKTSPLLLLQSPSARFLHCSGQYTEW